MQALQHFCEAPLVKALSISQYVQYVTAAQRLLDTFAQGLIFSKSYTKLQNNLFSVTMDWINPT